MTEKDLYHQIVEEIGTGQLDRALWAMAWTKAGGDENKAKASYIEMRVVELKSRARQTSRNAAVSEWRNIFRATQEILWMAIWPILLVNVAYLYWCFRRPPNTGAVASVAAIIGFNLVPLLLGICVLLSQKRNPKKAVESAAFTFVIVAAVMFILTWIDTWNRFHPSHAYSYPVVMADGRRGAIDSDSPLTAEQLQAHLDGYNRMDAAEASQRATNPEGLPWLMQFEEGFASPFQSAIYLFK